MAKAKRLLAFAALLGLCAAGAQAAGAALDFAALVEANDRKLNAAWLELKPRQGDAAGFTLGRDGSLSHGGRRLQPQIEVVDAKGRPSRKPSSVRISPLSPSGRYALLTACEPVAAPNNLCWFQFLADLREGRLHSAAWAKYPMPAQVWWAADEARALVPIADEGETWLATLDLASRESLDLHFDEVARAAPAAAACRPGEDGVAIDLDSLRWLGRDAIGLNVVLRCADPARTVTLAATARLDTGAVAIAAAPAPSFDCAKAATPVEKTICADANLARLDGELVAAYRQAIGQARDGEALKSEQQNWLRQVRNKCPSAACLADAYRARIAALPQGAAALPAAIAATYAGGFTGKEKLTLSADGRVLEDGRDAGRYAPDHASPWRDAQYPLLLVQPGEGRMSERHCKLQPDLRKLICNDGGTLAAEYERLGPPPALQLPAARKCDDEQLYLDVMAAARQARPDLELKGATDIVLDASGRCRIGLYYLKDGQAIGLDATYGLNERPVRLRFAGKP
jgi:uncharacterized protein YecT (DUF1311 family)